MSPPERSRAAIWHDLECGSYAADLPLWRELTRQQGSRPVLDVGAGTGRVALDLAHAGRPVTAVDRDPELLRALAERAMGLDVQTVCADARSFQLEQRDYGTCVIAMQTIQLLGGADARVAFLRCARAHLRPGALVACAIVTELDPFDAAAGDELPSPEIALVDGAHYVSRPTRVAVGASTVRIERERRVLDAGKGTDEPSERERDVIELDVVGVSELERDGRLAGLAPAGTRTIPPTPEHVGSEVVLLRA